jgi:uncharacterized membrane protein (DUF485 family)
MVDAVIAITSDLPKEETMQDVQDKIRANPKFQKLVAMRNSYALLMTILMIVVYFGYILLIAFNKSWLATKLVAGTPQSITNEAGEVVTQIVGASATSYGIPLGVGVILFTIILTNIYVRRANTEFDTLNAEVIKEAQQ